MRSSTILVMAVGGAALLAVPAATVAERRDAAPVSAGERAFQKCYSCHALGDTDEGAPGPSLKGIVDRPVASWPRYDYSAALRAHARQQPRWSRRALDAFLANPQRVVPDTEMAFFGLKDPAERAALIEYLAAH